MNVIDRLRAEGKVTELSDEEVEAIREHISKHMRAFRAELGRKERQSEDDTRRIILSLVTPTPDGSE